MDDDWGETTFSQPPSTENFDDEGGRSYGKGRGFVAQNNNNDWDTGFKNSNDGGDSGWGATDFNTDNSNDFGGGRPPRGGGRGGRGDSRGGRGDGRGRGRGGGGRGGYRNRQDDDGDNFGDSNKYGFDNDDENGGFKPSHRGGRGGGGFRNRNDGDGDDDNFANGGFDSRGGGGGFRGGRGRGGRGGRGGRNGDNDGDDNPWGGQSGGQRDRGDGGDDEKPREIYIPPECTDEQALFENGVEMGINFDKYDNIEVSVTGENAPQRYIETFEEAGLRSLVIENIKKSGYTKPTPIQKRALPIIMSGRDVMACAQTGSGKTAAFAVPIINTLLEDPRELVVTSSYCEPQVVIVSPTRELTIQIWEQVKKFSVNSILKCVVAYGGTSVQHQAGKLHLGCHILVATPGRLLDFLERGRLKFSSVRFLVLDEADRMLDMGFLPGIEKMVDHETMVPMGERQTLMFSATFPDEVQHLARRFLNNYLFITVGIVGGACTDVEQNFYEVTRNKKKDMLKEIMAKENDAGTLAGTLVFVEMKRKADFIAAFLSEINYPTTSIHGDRLQRQREEALADFKSGRMAILVATAVAARGLDIKNVAHVINFDMPKSIDEYVHRIGRTGRVGNRGRATSFYDPEDDAHITGDLVKILKQADQQIPDWLLGGSSNQRSYAPGKGSRFGGHDIRNFGDEGGEPYAEEAYAPPAATEADEEW